MASTDKTLLLVDDKPGAFVAYEAIFSGSGYQLLKATSGYEAIRIAKTQALSLILMNVQMPFMDGFQTAEELRRVDLNRSTPIIFVTASDPDQVRSKARDFLFKPFSSQDLTAKLEEVLNRSAGPGLH